MAAVHIEKINDTTFTLSGDLTRLTIPTVFSYTSILVDGQSDQPIQCDCAGVTHIDSAGVAALLEWVRTADKNKRQIFFTHIPPRMQSLIDVSRLSEFFTEQDLTNG